ncbi:MAG: MFS transporter, FHS family, L-fucose permease [Glomeribacter sp. 1016415]|nr:MFS transporter, FHS family, L-fucose permease [Glomeribacter sp. 1016415]
MSKGQTVCLSQFAQKESRYRMAFALITGLFFMWGLSYGLLDVLNKHFQETLHVTKAQSGLLQAAYFSAYFLIAIPAALLMEIWGYKKGILLGLCLFATGALLFIPASTAMSFPYFLLALFVIASGLACLETAANPYVAVLGASETTVRRLNLSQSFCGLGCFIGPLIGGAFFFSSGETGGNDLGSVQMTYAIIGGAALLMAALVDYTSMPDIREEKTVPSNMLEKSLIQHRHFVFGVIAQFFYVAAQVGIWAFFINYVTEQWSQVSSRHASFLLSLGMLCFTVGRFVNTMLMGRFVPNAMLVLYALINVALTFLVVIGIPGVSVIALVALFFFMSIMFPTIFALSLINLGSHTKRGASLQVMAVSGGAVMPYLMGRIADNYSTALSFLLPMFCFFLIAAYGWCGYKVRGD